MIIPRVNLIAAVGLSGQLGLGGKLPWHDPDDLKWFKHITLGDSVLFGPGTLRDNPHLLELEDRRVIEDLPDFPPPDFYAEYVCPDNLGPDEKPPVLWIAGGAATYKRWLPYVRHVFLTRIEYDGPSDVVMPPLWDHTE